MSQDVLKYQDSLSILCEHKAKYRTKNKSMFDFQHKCIFNFSVSLYASCILIGLFINGAIPLFYEISCEASYPVAEGVTGGFLTMINNVVGIMFLMVMLDKSIGENN